MEKVKEPSKLTNVTVDELKEATKIMNQVNKKADETEIVNRALLTMLFIDYVKIKRMYKLFLVNVAIYAVLIVAYFYK